MCAHIQKTNSSQFPVPLFLDINYVNLIHYSHNNTLSGVLYVLISPMTAFQSILHDACWMHFLDLIYPSSNYYYNFNLYTLCVYSGICIYMCGVIQWFICLRYVAYLLICVCVSWTLYVFSLNVTEWLICLAFIASHMSISPSFCHSIYVKSLVYLLIMTNDNFSLSSSFPTDIILSVLAALTNATPCVSCTYHFWLYVLYVF